MQDSSVVCRLGIRSVIIWPLANHAARTGVLVITVLKVTLSKPLIQFDKPASPGNRRRGQAGRAKCRARLPARRRNRMDSSPSQSSRRLAWCSAISARAPFIRSKPCSTTPGHIQTRPQCSAHCRCPEPFWRGLIHSWCKLLSYNDIIRARSNSRPARPYIARLRVFNLLIWPSVCPLLQGSITAFRTASRASDGQIESSGIPAGMKM
jgi:hypothetical protein